MGLESLTFLFLFLPASMLVYYLCPNRAKNAALAGISLAFWALADFWAMVLLVASVLIDYGLAVWIVRAGGNLRQRRLPMLLSVVKNLGLMALFGALAQLGYLTAPLGLTVCSMTSLGYLIDIYRGDAPLERDLSRFLVFSAFFGKLWAGPVISYGYLQPYLEHKELSLSGIGRGMTLFVLGLAKKVILSGGSWELCTQVQQLPAEETSVLSVWLLVISFTFGVYFSISGFCDMARGLAKIFAMDLPENFHYPFQSRTVTDFFHRFNITVNRFFEEYVFLYLGGAQNGVAATILNTLVTAMLMGLWFGIRLNYLAWGVYIACFMLLERYWLEKYLSRIPPIFDRVYTFAVVILSFAIFAAPTLGQGFGYLKVMFGLCDLPLTTARVLYLIRTNYLLLLLCFFSCTSLVSLVDRWLEQRFPSASHGIAVGCSALLAVVTVAFIL